MSMSDAEFGPSFAPRIQLMRGLLRTTKPVIIAAMRENGIGPRNLSRRLKDDLLAHCNAFAQQAPKVAFDAFWQSLERAACQRRAARGRRQEG